MSQKYKLAVLDIAGTTLVDKDFVAIAFVEAFTQFGVEVTFEEINPLMGFKKTEAIATMLERKGVEFTPENVEYIHNIFMTEMVRFYTTSPEVEALPGAEDLFTFFKEKDIVVALNSGFPRLIVDAIVDRMQWMEKGFIDFTIASDEVERGRPFPFMINSLMAQAGITVSKEVIKVGDTMVDIQEGKMAGCGLVFAVTTGAYSHKQLEAYNPDYIISSLAELKNLIDE